jgi:hypothetical protein
MWLITGIAIAFAILGTLWRREDATWNYERALLQQERADLELDIEQQ